MDWRLVIGTAEGESHSSLRNSLSRVSRVVGFDNIKIHQIHVPDALQVGNMNLTPDGKNTLPMRDGYYIHPDNSHTLRQQFMMLPDGPLQGLKIVLQEGGLWPAGQRFLTQCSIPDANPGERTPNPACRHATNANCCARALFSSQPDFQAQKCQLQETLEAGRPQVIFYPVFHCELNFIDYFWGQARLYTRGHCEYSFPSLVRTVPVALAQFSN